MKKLFSIIVLCLVALMTISGCASSSAEQGKETEITKTVGISADDVFGKALANKEGSDLASKDYGQGLVAANGNPEFEDFDWYEDLIYSGIPENVSHPKVKYIEGIWKYRMRIRRDNSVDGYSYDEIGIADLSLDYENVELIINLHAQAARNDYEMWPLNDEIATYEEFRGGFNDRGGMTLSGNDLLVDIDEYYEYEGNEYVLGSMYKGEEFVGNLVF